jgi:hypothetical protein
VARLELASRCDTGMLGWHVRRILAVVALGLAVGAGPAARATSYITTADCHAVVPAAVAVGSVDSKKRFTYSWWTSSWVPPDSAMDLAPVIALYSVPSARVDTRGGHKPPAPRVSQRA